ncbi:hypothetical protein [Dyella sp. 20L07]|uniref:hypothetical protein n=1 Tax=Dyella sp. 20L07 TaxID=3384240 RepID=UPI003D29D770
MERIKSSGDNARIAGRDFIQHTHYHGVADQPIEGKEIAPCRKCRKPIWVHASECPRCGYSPAVEAAQQQQRDAEMLERHRAYVISETIRVWICRAISAWLAIHLLSWEWAREQNEGIVNMIGFGMAFVVLTAFGGEVLREASHKVQDWFRYRLRHW